MGLLAQAQLTFGVLALAAPLTATLDVPVISSSSGLIFEAGVFEAGVFEEGEALDGWNVPLFVEVDADLTEAALLSSGRQQTAGFEIEVEGVRIPYSELVGGSSKVHLSMDGPNTFSFQVRLDDEGKAPWGATAFEYGGAPPPGKVPIDIYGTYATTAGVYRIPLLLDGLADIGEVTRDPEGGRRLSLTGNGAEARIHRKTVDGFILLPGHGLTRAGAVKKAFARAGIDASIADFGGDAAPGHWGRPFHAGIQIIGESPWEACRQVLEGEDRQLYVDWSGKAVAPARGYNPDRARSFTFNARDLLEGSFGLSLRADAPTGIIVTTRRQVIRDEDERVTVVSQTIAEGVIVPPHANFTQNGSDGTLQPYSTFGTGIITTPTLLEVGRTIVSREYVSGVLLSEMIWNFRWHAKGIVRYKLDNTTPNGSIAGYWGATPVWIYNADATKDDGSLAYDTASSRYQCTELAVTRHEYDDRGVKVGVTTELYGPVHPQTAIKSRDGLNEKWEDINCRDVWILGNGKAIWRGDLPVSGHTHERIHIPFYPPSVNPPLPAGTISNLVEGVDHLPRRETTVITADDDYFERGRTVSTEEWHAAEGSEHLYGGGDTRADQNQVFRVSGTVETVETAEAILTIRRDHQGNPIEGTNPPAYETRDREEGFLPAAEVDLRIAKPPRTEDVVLSVEEDGTEVLLEFERRAQLGEEVVEELLWEDERLAEDHEEWTGSAHFPYAEEQELLKVLARSELREAAAGASRFAVPALFTMRPATRVGITLKDVGANDRDLYLRDVDHEEGADGRIVTSASGRVYVIA